MSAPTNPVSSISACTPIFDLGRDIPRRSGRIARAADGMPALGISDLANLFGMVKFYKGARSKGVKPIIGCDVWITNDGERDKPARALLICRNRRATASCASC